MKKLILTAILLSMPVFAYENYMIISEQPVKSVISQNPEILSAKPVFTIDNSKKNIILNPKAPGNTTVLINLHGTTANIDVKIEKEKTTLKKHNGFKYFLIDNPPKPYPIPEPPIPGGN